MDLLKDDEAVPEPIIVDQDAPEADEELPKERRWTKHHPASNIIENLDQGVTTRRRFQFLDNTTFVSLIEPKSIAEALQDESWILAMQDELNQFQRKEVWYLILRSSHQSVIRTKWVFRNKMNEDGIVTRKRQGLLPKDILKKRE